MKKIRKALILFATGLMFFITGCNKNVNNKIEEVPNKMVEQERNFDKNTLEGYNILTFERFLKERILWYETSKSIWELYKDSEDEECKFQAKLAKERANECVDGYAKLISLHPEYWNNPNRLQDLPDKLEKIE